MNTTTPVEGSLAPGARGYLVRLDDVGRHGPRDDVRPGHAEASQAREHVGEGAGSPGDDGEAEHHDRPPSGRQDVGAPLAEPAGQKHDQGNAREGRALHDHEHELELVRDAHPIRYGTTARRPKPAPATK